MTLLRSARTKSKVLTLTFDNPKKLNAWTLPLLSQLFDALQQAATDDKVNAVVVSGAGKYYSAGVDLPSLLKPMAPSKLVRQLRDQNQLCFKTWLDFPKPIVAAVNGPAIGAAVTSSVLADAVVASERATFSLPFAKLGVPPEGCSSVTWPERMGEEAAQRMLGPENWTPTAAEAKAAGLIDEVVPLVGDGADLDASNAAVVARAVEVAEAAVAAGRQRRYAPGELDKLQRVNAEESARLANAFVSPKFLDSMAAWNRAKGKTSLANGFWAARVTLPLWVPTPIEPQL